MKSLPAGLSSSLYAYATEAVELLNNPVREGIAAAAGSSFRIPVMAEAVFADMTAAAVEAALDAAGLQWRDIFGNPLLEISEFTTDAGTVRTFVSGSFHAPDLLKVADIKEEGGERGFVSAMPVNFTSNVGLVDSQGDRAQRSDDARAQFSIDGTGVTVGAISDSFGANRNAQGTPTDTTVAQDVANGDLPNVNVLFDSTPFSPDGDEGRAMLQLIYDVAPGTNLAFHASGSNQATFANGILELAQPVSQGGAGADIIVDDIIFFAEPFFQDGVIAQAVDTVVSQGTAYFSSAGNGGDDGFRDVFRDSGVDGRTIGALDDFFSSNPSSLGDLHDWNDDPNVFSPYVEIEVPVGEEISVSFQWDEPFASVGGRGSTADYDIYITTVVNNVETLASDGASFTNNIGGDAVEIAGIENTSNAPIRARIYITQFDGPDSVSTNILQGVFFGASGRFQENFAPQIQTDSLGTLGTAPQFGSPTSFGHSNAEGTIAVGASAFFNTPEFGLTSGARLNSFSAQSGFDILFDEFGNRLATPDVRDGVDFVAPDGGNTTFFGSDIGSDTDSFPNFFGTSASAPHAAAIAALMLQVNPDLTPTQIEELLEAASVSSPITLDSANRSVDESFVGAGFVDAVAAVQAARDLLQLNGAPTPVADAAATTEDSPVTINVLANDTDPDQDSLSLTAIDTSDTAGIVSLNQDGTVTYDPNGQFDFLRSGNEAVDSFSYTVEDSGGATATATVSVTVNGIGGVALFGTDSADDIAGTPEADEIFAGLGNDTVNGLGADDIIDGGAGMDVLVGDLGADEIYGGSERDTIIGGEGNDAIFGDDGNDAIAGGLGADRIVGGSGNDLLIGDDDSRFDTVLASLSDGRESPAPLPRNVPSATQSNDPELGEIADDLLAPTDDVSMAFDPNLGFQALIEELL